MTGMERNPKHPPRLEPLPHDLRSLAGRLPDAAPGTLFLRGLADGLAAPPRPGFSVLFGRNAPDVHLCVGVDDPRISRCHGRLTCHGTDWWLQNDGRLPIRFPGSALLLSGKEIQLKRGYSALFIQSSREREHLLEVAIARPAPDEQTVTPEGRTAPPDAWPLEGDERLVVIALARRYLYQEDFPQPQAWKQVAADLNAVRPGAAMPAWDGKRAERVVTAIRARLSAAGVPGLTRDEVGEPVGNALNHNLIHELLATTTITPPDLRLLGIEEE